MERLFKRKDMAKVLFWAKGERIDKQYYTENQQTVKVTKESCNEMILKTEDFLVKMKLLISNIGNEEINSARNLFP